MNKIIKVLAIAAGVLLLLSIGGAILLFTQAPPLQEQIPQSSLVVTLTEPQSGSVLLQGGPYTVRAEVVGPANISAVELWANGFLVGTTEASATGGYSYQAKWDWTITSPGQQTLYARAFDVQGQVVVSTPIVLAAVQTANSVGMETYLAQEGDTLAQIAENKNIPLQDLQTYNGSDPQSPLPAGEPVYLPESSPPPELGGQTGGETLPEAPQPAKDSPAAAPDSPNPAWFWLQARLNKPDSPPQAPLLSGEAPTCTATLYIGDQSDNEQGFLIYRYHPNSGQWAQIADTGAQQGTGSFIYMDETALPNTGALYMVEAFNAAGLSASVPVEVLPGDTASCPQTEWQGIPIVNKILVLTPAYQRVYLYLSLNNGQFQRVPADPGQYLPAVQNGYDLAPYLDDLIPAENAGPEQVVFEVWGWQGSSLTRIGGGGAVGAERADFPLPVNTGKLEISQYGNFSDVSFGVQETYIHPSPWELGWYGINLASTQGRVQVSLTPFSGAASLNPPGLIAEKDISLGTFKLEFGEIFGVSPEEPTPTVGPVNANNNQGNYTLNPNIVGLFPGASGGGQSSPGSALSGLQLGSLSTSPISTFSLAANPLDLYIRVVPLQDSKIAGQPTNTVIGHYVPPDPNQEPIEIYSPVQIDPIYQTKIIKYQPPDFEDPNRWGCVVITGYNNEDPSMLINGNLYKQMYPVGKEFCPKSYKGGNTPTLGSVLGDLFNGFKSLFNFVTGLYNDIKAYAIDLVLKVLPCSDLGLEKECKGVISAAVDYGLTAVGLPPSLPDFDQFANAAKGEMVDLIVEEALAKSPVPCEGECKDKLVNAIEQTVDKAINDLTKTSVATGCVSKSEAHEHGREPLCFPDGIIVKPALHAADQPASAVVEVSLPAGTTIPPDYPECTISVGIQVSKYFQAQNWYGAGGWLKYPIEAQTVTMNPYYNEHFTIKPLAPGQSATYVVVFDKVNTYYYLPWTSDMYKHSQEVPSWRSDWYAAVRHANAVLSTKTFFGMSQQLYTDTSSCATPDQVQFTMP